MIDYHGLIGRLQMPRLWGAPTSNSKLSPTIHACWRGPQQVKGVEIYAMIWFAGPELTFNQDGIKQRTQSKPVYLVVLRTASPIGNQSQLDSAKPQLMKRLYGTGDWLDGQDPDLLIYLSDLVS